MQIKRQRINGVEFPRYGAPGEGDLENWYLASGKRMFDEDLQPTFGKDALFKDILDKLYQGYTGDQDLRQRRRRAHRLRQREGRLLLGLLLRPEAPQRAGPGHREPVRGGHRRGLRAGQLTNYVNPSFVAGKTGTQAICRQYAVFSGTKYPQQAWH